MNGIAIYMEGGGNTAAGKAAVRQGMSQFLRSLCEAARSKRLSWRVVACGARHEARDAFLNAATAAPDEVNMLLVDSEVAVDDGPSRHLERHDGWNLGDFPEDCLHLMIQTMESWIAADAGALAKYYGQDFLANALPAAQNLEMVEKARIESMLLQATRQTQKGEYRKISHASALLAIIDPVIVGKRCPSCQRFLTSLTRAIDAA